MASSAGYLVELCCAIATVTDHLELTHLRASLNATDALVFVFEKYYIDIGFTVFCVARVIHSQSISMSTIALVFPREQLLLTQ